MTTSVMIVANSTTHLNQTVTTVLSNKKPLLIQGQELIQKQIKQIDRRTLIWSTIALAGLTCLVLMYIIMKTFMLRKKRQSRRYKLLSNATTMEEPLFNEHAEDDDEKDDDTLFVRR
ncbi:unnamed protein product [Adineta ricciae]|uniref:Uncharacterized protein n=1 Tax=Adineta ricciae TaxID=249248 RepID=A0A813UR15_ADIRI|nr:unnamed protein product [Adineta ricciae]CAF1177282.1 unnamed protein product [Adineta ricciae]